MPREGWEKEEERRLLSSSGFEKSLGRSSRCLKGGGADSSPEKSSETPGEALHARVG